jgi:hypothetical protein
MAGIQKEIVIGFKGEKYTVPLSMALANGLEMQGINLLKLRLMMDEDAIPPTSLLSSFYALLLNSVDVDVTAEDVWSELINSDAVGLINASKLALYAMFPASAEAAAVKKPKPKAAKV